MIGQPHQRLEQQLQHDRQHHRQHDWRCDIQRRERREQEHPAQKDRSWLGGQRHLLPLLAQNHGRDIGTRGIGHFHHTGTHTDAPIPYD
jgi:hypothetical protein